jgi:hypothetical protein
MVLSIRSERVSAKRTKVHPRGQSARSSAIAEEMVPQFKAREGIT